LSVDTFFGSLYTFVGDANGTRAISFLQHLCETLSKLGIDSMNTAEFVENIIQAMPIALLQLLRREPRTRLNLDLACLTGTMEDTTKTIAGRTKNLILPITLRTIQNIRAIVALANESVDTVMSAYSRNLAMPRDRHDNDKLDITNIKIFPTLEDIMSDAVEFLPSSDPDQPHYLEDKVERHIDTCFRLHRHDTFGELKEALSFLIHTIEDDPTLIQNYRLQPRDFRAFYYANAYISRISFDTRRGLEIHPRFQQPTQLRKNTAAGRSKWWRESKRVAEGILLSLIVIGNDQVQHLFFNDSGTNTNTREDLNLVKNNSPCTITTKLVSHNQTDIISVVRSSCEKFRGVLLEFRGVTPATFAPIRESLQGMQRHSILPFSQWILPDKVDSTKTVNVPMPLYTRRPASGFNLESIVTVL
ncbi:hypothetical protein BS50DRAFT_506497, partial [Corynespora cassiicola Philippines]